MYLAARLRELRKKKKLSGGQVATYMGISGAHVSDLENNKARPSLDLLIRLAEYYNCSTDYLLGLTDDPSPAPHTLADAAEGILQEIASLSGQLSAGRRLELLRIAEALYELEQEAAAAQPTLAETIVERVKYGEVARIVGAEPA